MIHPGLEDAGAVVTPFDMDFEVPVDDELPPKKLELEDETLKVI